MSAWRLRGWPAMTREPFPVCPIIPLLFVSSLRLGAGRFSLGIVISFEQTE
jgi:hypothetical protein